jgi:hypothetical protein
MVRVHTKLGVCLLPLLLTGCLRTAAVRTLGSAVAMKGKDVSSSALSVYDELAKQADIDRAQQDYIKVVTSPDPERGRLPDTQSRPFARQLEPRIAAYRALLDAYSKYQTLSGKDFGKQTETAAGSLLTGMKSLSGVPDLPSAVTTLLPKVAGMIMEAQRAKDIRKYNRALVELSTAYQSLWDRDLPIWKQYLERIYGDYADGFKSVDVTRFDRAALAGAVKDPFTVEIKMGLYKLQMRNDAFRQRDALIGRLDQVSESFRQLESGQAELMKAKPNVADALAELDQINSIHAGAK